MLANERLKYILEQLTLKGTVKNNALIQELGVSQMTILRDLQELEKNGKLIRIHGGAQLVGKLLQDDAIDNRMSQHKTEKDAVSRHAASIIQEESMVYLDAGSTTAMMIPYLNPNITVITNSIEHAQKLTKRAMNCVILGGKIKLKTNAIIGLSAYLELSKFNFDYAFIGVNGIDLIAGFTTPSNEEGELKKLVLKQSKHAFFVADAHKFDRTSFFKIADLTGNYRLITTKCPENYLSKFQPHFLIETQKLENAR